MGLKLNMHMALGKASVQYIPVKIKKSRGMIRLFQIQSHLEHFYQILSNLIKLMRFDKFHNLFLHNLFGSMFVHFNSVWWILVCNGANEGNESDEKH